MTKLVCVVFILILLTSSMMVINAGESNNQQQNIRVKRASPLCSIACCGNPFAGCGYCRQELGYRASNTCPSYHVCACK
uniref:Uncharacterized protein n=1 Tax=Panagrolaimus sp. PS1159 TaxID=55785 RepID=A0AC35GAL2_9BILA